MKIRFRLREKLMLITVVTILLFTFVIVYLNLSETIAQYKQSIFKRVFTEGLRLSWLINDVVELGLNLGELEGLNYECQKVTEIIPYAKYCFIMDDKGKIYYHNSSQEVGKVYSDPITQNVLQTKGETIQTYKLNSGEKIYDFSRPIEDISGNLLGFIRIGVNSAIIDKEAWRMVKRTLGIWLLFGGLACLCIYILFNLSILKNIKELMKAVKIIGKGELDYKIKLRTKDELGELAMLLNTMTEDLKKTTVSLERLYEEQRRFQDVAISSGDWIWEVDAQGRYIYCSPVVEKILGYKPEEVINRYFYDFFLPEEREELKRKAFEVFKKKEPFKNFLNKNLTKDGRTVIVETTATPVIDKEGRLLGYRGLDRDVTEQVTSEIALCEAEERYRIQFEEALDGIVIADAQTGIIVNCNSSMAKMVKRTKEELIGQHQSILHPPEEIEGGFSKTFKQHLGEKEGEALEDKIITKEGEIRYVSIKANKLRIKEKEYLQGIFRDITETKKAQDELKIAYEKLKQTQAQLVQSAKMASVGILAGGVAHEINNPLVGVLNNVQLIKMMVQENKDFNLEEFKELLDIIEASALRCAKITRSLLDFSRSSEGLFKSVSLNELAERVIILIQHELGLQNVIIKKEFANELPLISADSQLLQQAIFDIISNAKWAIQKKSGKQGGTITLKTAYDKENKQVLLYISDTGIGIPQENLERIFEPFFTTKEVGEGTGLGLYIVYNIIKEHKGTITVESQFGKGTTFKISLPALV